MVSQAAHKTCREEHTNKKDIALHLKRKSANLTPTEMVTLTEKGCRGINATDESRGEKLFAMVSQAAHKTCREEHTNKKDIALHLKRKSAKKTNEKSEGSN